MATLTKKTLLRNNSCFKKLQQHQPLLHFLFLLNDAIFQGIRAIKTKLILYNSVFRKPYNSDHHGLCA